jgi:hypothetical protein
MNLFLEQLKENYAPEFSLDGILYFKERTGKNELLRELENKRKKILAKLKALEKRQINTLANIHETGKFSAEAIFEHHRCHYEAEAYWLEKTIEGLLK